MTDVSIMRFILVLVLPIDVRGIVLMALYVTWFEVKDTLFSISHSIFFNKKIKPRRVHFVPFNEGTFSEWKLYGKLFHCHCKICFDELLNIDETIPMCNIPTASIWIPHTQLQLNGNWTSICQHNEFAYKFIWAYTLNLNLNCMTFSNWFIVDVSNVSIIIKIIISFI